MLRILNFLNANIGYVPIHESSTNPAPDFSILEEEFSKNGAKVLVLSNPNNPTGFVYSEEQLKTIATLAEKYDITVLIDSLYSRLFAQWSSLFAFGISSWNEKSCYYLTWT